MRISRQKRVFQVLLGVFLFLAGSILSVFYDYSTRSDYTWLWRAELRPQPSGAIEVTETIVQDFGSIGKHGIERTIPLVTTHSDQDGTYQRVWPARDLVVTADATTPTQTTTSLQGTSLTVRIGDPNRTVTGPHTYQIRYTLDAALTPTQDGWAVWMDAFRDWPHRVRRTELIVYHEAVPLTAECFRSLGDCVSVTSTPTSTLAVAEDLMPLDAFTIKATFRSASFPGSQPPLRYMDVALSVPSVSTSGPVDSLLAQTTVELRIPASLWVVAVLLATTTITSSIASRRRARRIGAFSPAALSATFTRSPEPPTLLAPPGLLTSPPLHVDPHGPPPLEFLPPAGLRPAELAALYGQDDLATLYASTVVDLAARGLLDLDRQPSGSWTVTWTAPPTAGLSKHEQIVAGSLLAGAPRSTIPHAYDPVLTAASLDAHRAVITGLEQSGCRNRLNGKLRSGIDGVQLLSWALFAPVLLLGLFNPPLGVAAVVARIVFAVALRTPLRADDDLTEYGAALRFRVAGFVAFMEQSEAHHDLLAANAGLLRDYMGYAIALDLVDTWTKAFAGIFTPPATSAWMQDPHAVLSLSSSLRTSTTTPTASGGSSSSGGRGGGSGGGGGGGGSW